MPLGEIVRPIERMTCDLPAVQRDAEAVRPGVEIIVDAESAGNADAGFEDVAFAGELAGRYD